MNNVFNKIEEDLSLMLGGRGVFGIPTATTQTGKKYKVVRINSSAIISILLDDEGNDALALNSLGTIEWATGTIINLGEGRYISSIRFSQGDGLGIIE